MSGLSEGSLLQASVSGGIIKHSLNSMTAVPGPAAAASISGVKVEAAARKTFKLNSSKDVLKGSSATTVGNESVGQKSLQFHAYTARGTYIERAHYRSLNERAAKHSWESNSNSSPKNASSATSDATPHRKSARSSLYTDLKLFFHFSITTYLS